MKSASIILTITGIAFLGLGVWFGHQEIKYIGFAFWILGSLANLIPFLKSKIKNKGEAK